MNDIYDNLISPKDRSAALIQHNILYIFIMKCNHRYYNHHKPLINDELYDYIYNYILSLEEQYNIQSSLTKRVGALSIQKKNKHIYPLYSLRNLFSMEEFRKFEKTIHNYINCNDPVHWILEPKLDGICINLKYVNGMFVSATTRGNGLEGTNITEKFMKINSVPKIINNNDIIEIYGELVMYNESFNREQFANSRNEIASFIQKNDIDSVVQNKVLFYPHGVNPYITSTYIELKALLEKWNFLITPYIQSINCNHQFNINIQTDGLVFKLNNISLQKRLGYTNKYPRYAIAYKFNRLTSLTRVNNIIITLGRTGLITPVALIDEVTISGSKINRVSINTINFDIRINDKIEIVKSGDIIPFIKSVFTEFRNEQSVPYTLPNLCPFCQSSLSKINQRLLCVNDNCKERKIRRIIYFCQILKIKLGEKSVRSLYEQKIITDLKSIFHINDISYLNGWNQKSYNNLSISIEKARYIKYELFLAALGIPNIGLRIASMIANGGIEQLGIGDEIKKSYDTNILLINELKSYFTFYDTQQVRSALFRKRILLSGTLSMTRNEVKEYLIQKGAIIVTSISKNIDIVILGKKYSKRKLTLIRELPVQPKVFIF